MPKLKIFSSKTPKRESNATATATSSTCGCSTSNPIYEQLERIQHQSPLWCMRPLKTIALFKRDEAHTSSSDKGLAIGTFYHTFAVTRICLKERHGGSSTADDGSGSFTAIEGMLEGSEKDHDTDEYKQLAARQQLAASTMEKDGGNYYCIKHIAKKFYKKLHHGREMGRILQAVTNLLVEANYLSKCDHPHILRLQGQADKSWAVEDPKQKQCDAFFLITDRISETLEDRLEGWRAEQAKDPTRHPVDPKCPLFQKKLGYVRDIASALKYLHERQIMVLGLNPTGIGFLAQSGRLQLCDLGTCREMSALDASHDNNSQLEHSHVSPEGEGDIRFDDDEIGDGERFSNSGDGTGTSHSPGGKSRDAFIVPFVEAGTIPRYMAPEVVTQGAAGASLQADSYSHSMITVETLTLQKAYSSFKAGQFLVKVCMEGKRPNLTMYPQLPSPVEGILRRAWRHSAEKRWSCGEIFEGYKLIIEKLRGDDGSNPPSNDATKMPRRTLVLPNVPSPLPSSTSFEETSTMGQSVLSKDSTSSKVAPRKRTSKQQRREKRGTDSMSKSMSMRDFSSRNSMAVRRHSSTSDLFAAGGVPQRRRSDVDVGLLVIDPEEASSPAITYDQNGGRAVVATLPRKATSLRHHRSQEGEDEIEAREHSTGEPQQPDGHSQESQHKEDPTVEQPVPKGKRLQSASSDTPPDASDEAQEDAIVLGDGTTIAIKKQPSKRISNKKKEPSRRDLKAPQRSKVMKRSQSGPSLRRISSATDKAFGDVRPRSRRILSVDDAVPKVEETGVPPKLSPFEESRTKKPPQRKSSGTRKVGGSIVEHGNPSGEVPSSTKKLPRRKHSSESLFRHKPPTKQRDAPSTERKETDESRSNKAKHRRSIEVQDEPVLPTPQLQRHVSAGPW